MRKKAKGAGASFGLSQRKTPVFNPFGRGRVNQTLGAQFEAFIKFAAAREGLMLVENGLRARRVRDRVICVKSNLDFLVAHCGKVAVFDAKSFQGSRFGQGMLTPHQRLLAAKYAEHGVVSGFLVWLRGINHVGFYSAELLTRARAGFGHEDGVALGCLSDFKISRVWRSAP